jgi:hypothetical protein
MTKKKATREKYSPSRIDKLLSITPGDKGVMLKIGSLAEKWKKDLSGVVSTWYRLHKKKKDAFLTKTAKHHVSPTYAAKIAPMVFEQIEIKPRGWVNPKELESLHAGLELAMKDSFPHGKSIVISNRLADRAKTYLEERYPQHVFRFSKHPNEKIKDYKVLTKRN